MTCGLLLAAVSALSSLPWLGDGRAIDLSHGGWTNDAPAAVFRASFELPAGTPKARVTAAVLGYYELYLDGKPLTEIAPMPLQSVFRRTIWADEYEVRVKDGVHRLELRLGNGWYNIPTVKMWGKFTFRDALSSGKPCFKLAVDGVERLDWTWTESDLLFNTVQHGVRQDATRAPDRTPKPAVVAEGTSAEILPRTAPPVKVIGESFGTATWVVPGQVQVVDFGANATGVPEFDFSGVPRGTRVEVVYGELLFTNGTVNCGTTVMGSLTDLVRCTYNDLPYPALQRDTYVASGADREVFRPRFTWHIARYAEIRGLPFLVKRPRWHVISSAVADAEPGASFRSGEEDLNRIHEACRRTFRSNLISVQSDCPGRERLGYGGDAVATADALMLNYDMREFYLKMLRDFADEAEGDGAITETAPYVGIGDRPVLPKERYPKCGPIGWTLVVPHLIDRLWTYYGEKRALDFYPVAARFARLVDKEHPTGEVPACIGDHEAIVRISNEAFAVAHWHEFARLTAKIAALCGRGDDAREFAAVAEKVRKLFVEKYVKEGVVDNGSTSAQATALYLGLVPTEQIPAAEARLFAAIEKDCWHFSTGIFSTRYLLMYLHEHGKDDVARRLVLAKGKPGFLHMLDRGATTLWETWKEWDHGYSTCHPMFGSVDEWILRASVTDRVRTVIPQPLKVEARSGVLVTDGEPKPVFRTDAALADEAYRLEVAPQGVTIVAKGAAGRVNALATLGQLSTKLAAGRVAVPCCAVEDHPRFAWRGLLVDECRHFFGKETMKLVLDLMARYKLNRLHWHLTDAEAWRLDIPGHPEIVKHGAYNADHVAHLRNWKGRWDVALKGESYGPFFYTERDVKEILTYAAARNVTVVPEIEMPAHVRALLLSHPEFSCRGKDLPYEPHNAMGPQYEVLCAGNEEALRFMEGILDYVCSLFPSDTIGIGGDECPMNRWKACAKCQGKIRALGLGSEAELQRYLTVRMTEHLAKRGRKALAWDETICGKLPPTLTMQVWHGPEFLAEAAEAGCELVASCGQCFYFDGGKLNVPDDPYDWYGDEGTTLGRTYSFDPCAFLPRRHWDKVRGVEGCNWTEQTFCESELLWKMFPRALALAEVGWSDESVKDYGDFIRRARQHEKDLRNRFRVNCGPVIP